MKKLMAVLCVMALLVTAMLPAMAEQNNGMQGQPPKMDQKQGGPNGGAPSRPGNGQNGGDQTPPAKPDGDTSTQSDRQDPPAMPGQSASGTEGQDASAQPGMPGGDMNGQPGTQPGSAPQGMQDPLQKLVTDGKLSQTTYDAIRDYMKNNASSSGDDLQAPPARPEGETADESSRQDPPARPEGNDPGMGPQGQGGMTLSQETLQAMLNDGVITADEYDVLLAATAQPSGAAETTDTETADGSDA